MRVEQGVEPYVRLRCGAIGCMQETGDLGEASCGEGGSWAEIDFAQMATLAAIGSPVGSAALAAVFPHLGPMQEGLEWQRVHLTHPFFCVY